MAEKCPYKEVRKVSAQLSPEDAGHEVMTELTEPVVFTNMLHASWNKALNLTPQTLASLVPKLETKFKICSKPGSKDYQERFVDHETVFETQCTFVKATFGDFCEWLKEKAEPSSEDVPEKRKRLSNELLNYSRSDYWVYADYKHLCNLLEEAPELDHLTDWRVFGIEMETRDSTLWVGSDGAYTPCHYDTYGCNLVAQLSGQKQWLLFPPKDTDNLYPTRIPYEESSVFSSVNVTSPDLHKHPNYKNTIPYKVMLSAGEVLFVPRHWWHHVICMEPAISVNVWIPLPSDPRDRVKEGLVRTLTSSVMSSQSPHSDWLNPTEETFPFNENVHLLTLALREELSSQCKLLGDVKVTANDVVNSFCHPKVLDQVCQVLLDNKDTTAQSRHQ